VSTDRKALPPQRFRISGRRTVADLIALQVQRQADVRGGQIDTDGAWAGPTRPMNGRFRARVPKGLKQEGSPDKYHDQQHKPGRHEGD
jgi:hypothetical protein